ncbi:TlpA disulfide reductase family protein [uncultured Acetobacteroides sp.]|uniref:TlpA family protein disulfide reductase n=1 Tax=uncultured Acetobacteroides sp. TaxID=1760811 RepID=UPI0029F54D0F|nr:TlpA disulfide reductase family protein [uncultured Acetobacteroides sp.]
MRVKPFLKVACIAAVAILAAATGVKAQQQVKQKFVPMYIVNGEEVSEAKVNELAKNNRIKLMRRGLSDDEKAALIKKYGSRVDEAMVAIISVYTDEEMAAKKEVTKVEAEADRKAHFAQQEKKNAETTLVHPGDMAPDFTVEMLDGRKVKLSDLKGKVVLLNFWATWCGPCMMEFNEMPDKIVKRFENKDFVLVAISWGEKHDAVASRMSKLKARGIDFPVGIDPDKKIFSLYATESIPRNFIIDRNGKVAYVTIGYDSKKLDDIANTIEQLLKQ